LSGKKQRLNYQIIFVFLEEEIQLLSRVGFPQKRCVNHLTPSEAHEETRVAWQNRK